MEDTWEYLKTENAVAKFEGYIRGWMKQIQELLLESEQLRLETDDAGPQVWLFFKIVKLWCILLMWKINQIVTGTVIWTLNLLINNGLRTELACFQIHLP